MIGRLQVKLQGQAWQGRRRCVPGDVLVPATALTPGGPVYKRLPPPWVPGNLFSFPLLLLGGKGGVQGGAGGTQISYLFVLEVGCLLIIKIGLYLNKNQFQGGPTLHQEPMQSGLQPGGERGQGLCTGEWTSRTPPRNGEGV